MKFMMIVKSNAEGAFPPKELMDVLNKMSDEETKSGRMLGSGGLKGSKAGARVRLYDEQITVTDGPFAETKEIIGGYAQFEFKSKEEAVQSALNFMELHKKYWPGWQGETEVREMYGPDDFPCKP
jgi:hypothetical protein